VVSDRLTDASASTKDQAGRPTELGSRLPAAGMASARRLGSPRFHLDLYQMRSDPTVVRRLTSLPGANDSPAGHPRAAASASSRTATATSTPSPWPTMAMIMARPPISNGWEASRLTRDGRLMVRTSSLMRSTPDRGPAASIYSVGADGNSVRRLTDGYDSSRTGHRLAGGSSCFGNGWGHTELFSVRSDGSGVTQLTDDGADKDGPRWRPY